VATTRKHFGQLCAVPNALAARPIGNDPFAAYIAFFYSAAHALKQILQFAAADVPAPGDLFF
jgi:hypothetical protein